MGAKAPIIDEILGPLPNVQYPYRLTTLHDLVGEGLPASVISRLEKALRLSAPQSARILAVSETSRKRFKQTPRKRLDSAVSDRIIRFVSTISYAVEIFGDRGKAIDWFKTLSPALGDLQPIDLMTSDPGAKLVRDELNRIRYGHWA